VIGAPSSLTRPTIIRVHDRFAGCSYIFPYLFARKGPLFTTYRSLPGISFADLLTDLIKGPRSDTWDSRIRTRPGSRVKVRTNAVRISRAVRNRVPKEVSSSRIRASQNKALKVEAGETRAVRPGRVAAAIKAEAKEVAKVTKVVVIGVGAKAAATTADTF
jgi:hypothetical protein